MTLYELLTVYNNPGREPQGAQSGNKVEVPIFQRDYAQGRNTNDVPEIRKKFLDDIMSALSGKPINLNFVYGKFDKEGKFIPVDGQQRLTTLYLLHLYAFAKKESETGAPINGEWLNNFTYNTRRGTRRFLEELVKHRAEVFEDTKTPSEVIGNAPWYLLDWAKDPNVNSALVMLDDISNKFRNTAALFDKLTANNPPVTFNFLSMDDYKIDDSLYIKLNSTGRPLTCFEIFKSRLLGHLSDLADDGGLDGYAVKPEGWIREFSEKIDGDWTRFLWDRLRGVVPAEKNQRTALLNKVFSEFFDMLLRGYLTKGQNPDDINNWSAQAAPAAYYFFNYLTDGDKSSPTYEPFEKLLEKIIANANNDSEIQRDLTYKEQIQLHALAEFLLKSLGAVDGAAFADWQRVVQNLINNTQEKEISRAENFYDFIKDIDTLAAHYNDILDALANGSAIPVSGSFKRQLDEERVKAYLITQKYRNDVIGAENSSEYFGGQLRSALMMAAVENGLNPELNLDEIKALAPTGLKAYMEHFKAYWGTITAYVKVDAQFNDIRRALLTIGDYTHRVGGNPIIGEKRTLYSDGTYYDNSFKSLFADADKLSFTKVLIDKLSAPGATLDAVIQASGVGQTDWRYCFINSADPKNIFGIMKDYAKYIALYPVNNLVLTGTQANASYEMFTYALSLRLEKEGYTNITGYNGYYVDKSQVHNYQPMYYELPKHRIRYDKNNNKFLVWDISVKESDCDEQNTVFATQTNDVFDEIINDWVKKEFPNI